MNWSDERYVRLYTRDTVTWKRWKWETRAVLSLLLRKVDRAGVLETGAHDKAEAFALLVEVPVDVATLAISELLTSGTMTESANGYLLPTFIEAQESTQSDAARQRESRGKRRAANMRNDETPCHAVSHAVTSSHTVSQAVTPAVPSRAVPSQPDQPLFAGLALASPPAKVKPVKPKAEKPTNPRHAPLVKFLCLAFEEIRGVAYPFKPRDAGDVAKLLAAAEPDAIGHAWTKALRHQGFPKVSTLAELNTHLAHFVGTGPPASTNPRAPQPVADWTNAVTGEIPA